MAKKHFFRTVVALVLALNLIGSEMGVFQSKNVQADTICSSCGGTGKTMCINCGGSAMKTCPLCGGSGGTFQTVFGGIDPITGMMTQQQIRVSCTGCGGSGRIMCTSCNGTGRGICYNCGGTGRIHSGSSKDNNSSDNSNNSSDDNSSCNDSSDHKDCEYPCTTTNGTVIDATPGVVSCEGGINLLDGDSSTKFNFIATSGYIIWEVPAPISVKSYVLMTGNDTAIYTGRNPKSWVLYGSNTSLSRDSSKWKKIHSVTDDMVLEPKNFTEYTFKLKSAAKAYRYYKLEILDNKGDPCTQLSELTLNGKTITSKATSLSSVKKSETSIKVKWKKKSGVTGYQIQYSTSSKFKKNSEITIEGSDKASQTIKGIEAGKKYYVRVRTFRTVGGVTVYSKWSKKKSTN